MQVLLRLPGFPSAQDAMQRSREIAQENGFHAPSVFWFRWVQIAAAEWALELAPGEEKFLTDRERERLVMVNFKPVQIHPSPVYRYMAAKYVDDFFLSGRLRLSSFFEFSKHENENLRDEKEGWNVLSARGENSTMYAVTSHGHACLILCTSLLGSSFGRQKFPGSEAIEILNPLAFAGAVASLLPHCVKSLVGTCSYVDRRVSMVEVSNVDFTRLDATGGIASVMNVAGSILQHSPMFQKPCRYHDEQEFRFVWELSKKTPPFEFVEAPELRDLCRRVK